VSEENTPITFAAKHIIQKRMAMTMTPWVDCSPNMTMTVLDHPKPTNTPTPERVQVKTQTEGLMWSLKDPDTGRTYWQCTECNYFNKSAKSSKYKVERHVIRHHLSTKPPPVRKEVTPQPPNGVKKEVTEQDRQVEEMMGSLKDPTTSRMIWLCGKCNYSTSNSGKSRSSKFKMKRHILRLHIEGGRSSMQQQSQSGVSRVWNHSSVPSSARKLNCQPDYSSRGYTHKVEAQEPEETVYINLKAEGGIIDSELKREILKQQQQLLAQKAAENVPSPSLYYM